MQYLADIRVTLHFAFKQLFQDLIKNCTWISGGEYGAVTALGINEDCTRLLAGHARGQVIWNINMYVVTSPCSSDWLKTFRQENTLLIQVQLYHLSAWLDKV